MYACRTRKRETTNTSNTSVGRLQIGREVPLARMYVDQVTDSDVARQSPGTVSVEVGDDIGRTPDVVVAADTASKSHPAVDGAQHQDRAARLTERRERLMHTEVASI